MQIQLNTDNHTAANAGLSEYVEDTLNHELSRFGDRLTRVEVHLADLNSSQKNFGNDQRCQLEARPSGMKPVSVSEDAPTMHQAIKGAAEKMRALLGKTFDKLGDHKGRPSFAGEQE